MTAPSNGEQLVLGDLNGDAVPDRVLGTFSGVSVLFSGADGQAVSFSQHPLGAFTYDLVVEDMDADGLNDVVVLSESELRVLPGQVGGGISSNNITPQPVAAGTSPRVLATGDMDSDGLPDVVLPSETPHTIQVLKGLGAGLLAPAVSTPCLPLPRSLILADVDADGDLDVVTGHSSIHRAVVHKGDGLGGLTQAGVYLMGDYVAAVAVGDVTADGHPDLLSANRDSSDLSLRPGVGNGAFGAEQRLDLPSAAAELVLADVNADGWIDITVPLESRDQLAWIASTGDGQFAPMTTYGVGGRPNSLHVADLDGDGRLDLTSLGTDDILTLLQH